MKAGAFENRWYKTLDLDGRSPTAIIVSQLSQCIVMFKAVYHLLFLAFLSVARSTHTPVVDLGYAQYQGAFNASSNTTQFLGIRFAAPPTGKLALDAFLCRCIDHHIQARRVGKPHALPKRCREYNRPTHSHQLACRLRLEVFPPV